MVPEVLAFSKLQLGQFVLVIQLRLRRQRALASGRYFDSGLVS